MRNRTHLSTRSRRPNGPPQAAGRLIAPRSTGWPVFEMPIDLDGLAGLRTTVAAHVRELGAGGINDDIVLVVHELATNVVRHGGGIGRLSLWREGQRILCRVSDSGPGLGPALDEPPAPGKPGGRGLWIARRLAGVRIETGPTGTVVVAALAL